MKEAFWKYISSPVGYLKLESDIENLVSVSFSKICDENSETQPEILEQTEKQLSEYFAGNRKNFDLKLKPIGSEFQQQIWNLISKVPFGKTASYLDIANRAGSKLKTRAVGLANGKNPIPIIIPCHRIIGNDGKLTGYAGGIERKRWLLQHELKFSKPVSTLF